jgi:antitoxin ParD1/3/4
MTNAAEKLSITLTSEMVRTIRKTVESGEFASTSEVVRDAMRAWQRERLEHAERMAAIRARVRRSLDDPRPDLDADEVDRRLNALFAGTKKVRRRAKA